MFANRSSDCDADDPSPSGDGTPQSNYNLTMSPPTFSPDATTRAGPTFGGMSRPFFSWSGSVTPLTSSSTEEAALLTDESTPVDYVVVSCVFDGHGGAQSARYAQQYILQHIAQDTGLMQALGSQDEVVAKGAFKATYSRLDEAILALERASGARDGTTALVSVQLGGVLAVANAGDSRAVLARNGKAVRLSRDHTPDVKEERRRIEANGGLVAVAKGAMRVLLPVEAGARSQWVQACSVSRALGDPDFKKHNLIICEPEVTLTQLQPGADAAVIYASDGLWGRVSDQDAVDAVLQVVEEYSRMSGRHRSVVAKAAAKRLLQLALDMGSMDDITIIVSIFQWGQPGSMP